MRPRESSRPVEELFSLRKSSRPVRAAFRENTAFAQRSAFFRRKFTKPRNAFSPAPRAFPLGEETGGGLGSKLSLGKALLLWRCRAFGRGLLEREGGPRRFFSLRGREANSLFLPRWKAFPHAEGFSGEGEESAFCWTTFSRLFWGLL